MKVVGNLVMSLTPTQVQVTYGISLVEEQAALNQTELKGTVTYRKVGKFAGVRKRSCSEQKNRRRRVKTSHQ